VVEWEHYQTRIFIFIFICLHEKHIIMGKELNQFSKVIILTLRPKPRPWCTRLRPRTNITRLLDLSLNHRFSQWHQFTESYTANSSITACTVLVLVLTSLFH